MVGAQIGKDVKFLDGPQWSKIKRDQLDKFMKDDTCDDLSGSYSDPTGNLVMLDQVGCHVQLNFFTSFNKTHSGKVGVVNGDSMTIANMEGKLVTRNEEGGLDFGDNMLYGKLSEGEVEAAMKDSCPDVSGNYRDNKGDVASIGQEKCAVQVQMFWDDEEGHVTLGGFVFGDIMHLKNMNALGMVNATSGSFIFTDGSNWTRLTENETIDLGVPEEGCAKIGGMYKDGEGKDVAVKQTHCEVEVKFFLDTVDSEVTRQGTVAFNTVHIKDFMEKGVTTDGKIKFGSTTWELTPPEYQDDSA